MQLTEKSKEESPEKVLSILYLRCSSISVGADAHIYDDFQFSI